MASQRQKQYAVAALIGTSALFAQVWGAYKEFGLDSVLPKVQAMQEQLLGRLFESPHALSVLGLYAMVALVCHVVLALASVAVFRLTASTLISSRRESVSTSTAFVLLAFLAASFANRMLFPHSRA